MMRSIVILATLGAAATIVACAPSVITTSTSQPGKTPTPDPTAAMIILAWKTYRNETHGFAFEYPAIYDEVPYRASCGVKEDNGGIHLGARSGLLFFDSGGLSLAEYANHLLDGKDWQVEAPRTETVNGLEAITVEYRFGGMSRYGTFTLIKRGERIFAFEFTAGGFCDIPESELYELEAYHHMLESFRFDK